LPSPEPSRCADYRLRLFLSVDLAGSTAFKTGRGRDSVNGTSSQPLWVQVTRDFYREFPKLIHQCFSRRLNGSEEAAALSERYPLVWKTVGDEILFCCHITTLPHLALCIEAFLDALRTFGQTLDQAGKHLDVKGAGWLAAFPAPNVTVTLDDSVLTADQFDEDFERKADKNPRSVDFLGNGIDCGFRVAGCAASDRFALSVELAWLLAEAARRRFFSRKFAYHGRQILKGVLRDRPYPIVSIETERNISRQTLRDYERDLTGHVSSEPYKIRDFLEHFMRDEGIEFPMLPDAGEPIPSDTPPSYNEFRQRWLAEAVEVKQRTENEVAAANADAGEGTDLPADLVREVDAALAQAQKQDPSGSRSSTRET
jgi:hypothetical protein